MLRPKVSADDWAWMIDHSIQIGQCKCLVILGIRLSEFAPGRPLCHQDMEPIALIPMTGSAQADRGILSGGRRGPDGRPAGG